MSIKVCQYVNKPRSARVIAEGLSEALREEVLRINAKPSRSTYRGREGDIVINWGRSGVQVYDDRVVLINSRRAVGICADKRVTLTALSDYNESDIVRPIPIYRPGSPRMTPVVARTELTGHSGSGAVLIRPEDELIEAPLYTKYVEKAAEYRVHGFLSHNGGFSCMVTQKRKRRGSEVAEGSSSFIRSHENGWIHSVNNVDPVSPQVLLTIGEMFGHIGLDFGAADLCQSTDGDWYLLEINTAAGLGQTSVKNFYINNFTRVIKEIRGE